MTNDHPATDRRPAPRVDAHVHGFPDRLARAVRDHLNRDGRLRAGALLPEVAAAVTTEGFDRAWMLPYAHRAGVAAGVNEWSAEEARRFPSLIPGATFHPDDEHLGRLVERALVELRLPVVKLHCSVGRFAPTDPRLRPLWTAAARLRVPVVIHAGQRAPGETAAEEIDTLKPVLRAYPDLPLVLAHAGHPHTARTLELMAEFDNLYADLTPVWDRPVLIGVRELTGLAGRFLFGSDAPNNPIGARLQAARLEDLGLDAEVLALLMGGAACCLVPASSGEQASGEPGAAAEPAPPA